MGRYKDAGADMLRRGADPGRVRLTRGPSRWRRTGRWTTQRTSPRTRSLVAYGDACATLTPRIKETLRNVISGGVVEVRTDDPSAREDVCRPGHG